ncbi:chondroitin AC/alginate lyase [Mycena olivaceomarginata]|nr:chondroitin AC/alginate lyase [Mycena olivaceomarginata]
MSRRLYFSAAYVLLGLVAGVQSATPNTVVLDGSRLVDAKSRLAHDPSLKQTLASLTAQADSWLSQGPWSVTNKTIVPPGGDIHDYASQAPYFWASNTSDGCPYVERDGVHNPEADKYTDHNDRGSMFQSSYILTLAWYYTGNTQYATHAGNILRTCVVDAAAILASGAPGWSTSDVSAFRQWNVDFLNWLETSQFGQDESTTLVQSKANLMKPRIGLYITANGSQPQELTRTRSFHYSTFDLVAYTRMAAIVKKVGVDLWGYEGAQGQSINQAIDFIIPAATGVAKWSFPELNFTAFAASDIIHASADAGNAAAKGAVGQVPAPPGGDLWLLRPAVEQLDPVTS